MDDWKHFNSMVEHEADQFAEIAMRKGLGSKGLKSAQGLALSVALLPQ
jgi:hypothetical protein